MKPRHRFTTAAIAVAGIGGCAAALGAFLLKMLNNGLPWPVDQSAREHYRAVSTAYSGGFATGFFLCFFLMLLAMVAAAWFDHRRERARLVREALLAARVRPETETRCRI